MAEIKRIPLMSAPLPTSIDIGSAKSKKADKKKQKQIAPSIRFNLNLFESTEEKYPEFNYAQLLKAEEKKRKKEKKKEDNGTTNGAEIFNDDDDEKVLDVARYFEEKYGKRKKNDYVDLGAGYDESDSFIDNTDAYDELVPEEFTTVHGGFYVNSGPLEYKNSGKVSILGRKEPSDDDDDDDDEDDDEEDETSDDESDETDTKNDKDKAKEKEKEKLKNKEKYKEKDKEKVKDLSVKKKSKRVLSSSENDEAEDSTHPPKSKPRKEEILPKETIITIPKETIILN